ncbi:MAG: GNAT family N-acetyltransferase [Erysipelotrichaceae bacterium]|nr:GNAT family N-acetyltransferase [Erysipelotrichaceae bacterium]
MIKELDLLDNYEEFITDLNSDPCFSNPMLASEEDIKDNLYNALNKPDDHVFGVFQDDRTIGLFVFLILKEEKYIEMIIGLSRYRQAYEEILSYLQDHYPGFQTDFVFNPQNRLLKELLVQKNASFDIQQQKMILNDRGLIADTEGIETLSESFKQQYFTIHDKDRYWTGEKTAEATERFNIYIAKDNDDVIGYLDITKSFDDNEIFDLLVLEPYRRRGWGRKLIARAIEVNRPKKMFLTVDVDNLPAIRLYESMGFEKVNGQDSQVATWNISDVG